MGRRINRYEFGNTFCENINENKDNKENTIGYYTLHILDHLGGIGRRS